jgi:uncharacterized membrane protein YqhA
MGNIFHWLLKGCNFFTSVLFAIVGTIVLIYGGYESLLAVKSIIYHTEGEEKIIVEVLKGLDLVFLGIVIQILSVGIYELFVGPIKNLPEWLTIDKFDQLKGLLVKASITVVSISFVGRAVTWDGGEEIMHYGIGIGVIIAALSYFIKVKGK